MAPLPCDFIYIDELGNTQTVTLTDGNSVFICSAIPPVGIDGCDIVVINTGDNCINGECPSTTTTTTQGCNCFTIQYEINGSGDFDLIWYDCETGNSIITVFSSGYLQGAFGVCSLITPYYFDPGNPFATITFNVTTGLPCTSTNECPSPTTTTTTTSCGCWEVDYTNSPTGLIVYNNCILGESFYIPAASSSGVISLCSFDAPTAGNGLIINSVTLITGCIYNSGTNTYECPTTTTTTTAEPTTTQAPCNCWAIEYSTGIEFRTIQYTDCDGVVQTINLPANVLQDVISICSTTTPVPGSGVVFTNISQGSGCVLVGSNYECSCNCWTIDVTQGGSCNYTYVDCDTLQWLVITVSPIGTTSICSLIEPITSECADIVTQDGICTFDGVEYICVTTTSTTAAPTTTTTTLSACNCYFVTNANEGTVSFSYTDCDGNPATDSVISGGFAAVCGSNVETLGLPLTITLIEACVNGQCPIYCWSVENTGTTNCELLYVDYLQTYQTIFVNSGQTISICSYIAPSAILIQCSGDIQIFQGSPCEIGDQAVCPCQCYEITNSGVGSLGYSYITCDLQQITFGVLTDFENVRLCSYTAPVYYSGDSENFSYVQTGTCNYNFTTEEFDCPPVPCNCYHVTNPNGSSVSVNYLQCNGQYTTQSIPGSGFLAICGSDVQTLSLPLDITLTGDECINGQCPVYCWDVRNINDASCTAAYIDYLGVSRTVSIPSGETISICSYVEPTHANQICNGFIQSYQVGLCTDGLCACPVCDQYTFTVSQDDLDSVTGNTFDTTGTTSGWNYSVLLNYVECGYITDTTFEYDIAGIYTGICINVLIPSTTYGYFQDDVAIQAPDPRVHSTLNRVGCCCDCKYVSFNISQSDLDMLSGNTGPKAAYNNILVFGYADCDKTGAKLYFDTAGTYVSFTCASVDISQVISQFEGFQDDNYYLGNFESTFEFSGCCLGESTCNCYTLQTIGSNAEVTYNNCDSGTTITLQNVNSEIPISICSRQYPISNNGFNLISLTPCDGNDCPTLPITTTTTTISTPCTCYEVDFNVAQSQLNAATGNTNTNLPYEDHTVYLRFEDCSLGLQIIPIQVAGTYTYCVKANTGISMYYVQNSNQFIQTSGVSERPNDCCPQPTTIPPSPIPPPQDFYIFESCCNGEIFEAGPYPGVFVDGEVYYLTTSGFVGCATVSSLLTPANSYNGITATLFNDCDECKINYPC